MRIWNFSSHAVALCGALAFSFATGSSLAVAKTVVVKRTTIYVSTLPKGCVQTTYSGGIIIWKCGAIYYQPYKGRYVRVYIS